MTIDQLAKFENELYLNVIEIYNKEQTRELNEELKTIFANYKQVHKNYVELSNNDDEALKRGLFLQWYAWIEPSYLTGIGEIDQEAEKNIIDYVEKRIQNNTLDVELKWMLNYFATWDFVFDRFSTRKGLVELIANKTDEFFPTKIDNDAMSKRGQMGKYWNSLIKV